MKLIRVTVLMAFADSVAGNVPLPDLAWAGISDVDYPEILRMEDIKAQSVPVPDPEVSDLVAGDPFDLWQQRAEAEFERLGWAHDKAKDL